MSSVIKEISENIEVEEVIDDENTELVNEEENELSDYCLLFVPYLWFILFDTKLL